MPIDPSAGFWNVANAHSSHIHSNTHAYANFFFRWQQTPVSNFFSFYDASSQTVHYNYDYFFFLYKCVNISHVKKLTFVITLISSTRGICFFLSSLIKWRERKKKLQNWTHFQEGDKEKQEEFSGRDWNNKLRMCYIVWGGGWCEQPFRIALSIVKTHTHTHWKHCAGFLSFFFSQRLKRQKVRILTQQLQYL